MHLHCKATGLTEKECTQLEARLKALGFGCVRYAGSVALDYDGELGKEVFAIIAVFESFNCNRVTMLSNGREPTYG